MSEPVGHAGEDAVNEAERALFRAGQAAQFRRLVAAESPRLLHFAMGLCGDSDEAADLVQETWVRAYERRAAFEGRGPLYSWLLSICRSVFLTNQRTAARRSDLLAAGGQDVPGAGAGVPATHDVLARQRLSGAISDLPERQRDVIVLRLVEGLSTRETARRLAVPEGTVKSSLSRALDRLKDELEDLHR